MIDDMQRRSSHVQCKHNPSAHIKTSKKFLDYLLHKRDLLDSYTQTSTCAACGMFITFQNAYTSIWVKVLYASLSMILTYFATLIAIIVAKTTELNLLLITNCVAIAVVLVLIRIVDAMILSRLRWKTCKKENDILLRLHHRPKQHKVMKLVSVIVGVNLGNIIFSVTYLLMK